MPRSEISLVIILFLFAVIVVVYFIEKRERSRKERGKKNLQLIEEKSQYNCNNCGKYTDPDRGAVFAKNKWWCSEHYNFTKGQIS